MKRIYSISLLGLFLFLQCQTTAEKKTKPVFSLSDDGQYSFNTYGPSGSFYTYDSIHTIDISFSQPEYLDKLDRHYKNEYLLPGQIKVNGQDFGMAGFRYRGATSYQWNSSARKSFKVELDAFDEKGNINGYKTLNLNCNFEDPSYLREWLYHFAGSHYLPTLGTNMVHLRVNKQSWGPYSSVQQSDKTFLREWFDNPNGDYFRAIPPGGFNGPRKNGNTFGTGLSTMNYLGDEPALYQPHYTLRSNDSTAWQRLIEICKLLKQTSDKDLDSMMTALFEVDRVLWLMAHEQAFADDDGYREKGGMDYLIYGDTETKKYSLLEYDGNTVMLMENIDWEPMSRADDDRFPVWMNLMEIPRYRQRYLAHFREIMEHFLPPDSLLSIFEPQYKAIRPYIDLDNEPMHDSLEESEGMVDIYDFMRQRYDFLKGLPEFTKPAPIFTETKHQLSMDKNTINIQAVLRTNLNTSVKVYYYLGESTNLLTAEMKQKGALSGTVNYAIDLAIPENTAFIRYFLEAVDADSETLTNAPSFAAHQMFFVSCIPVNQSSVVVQSILSHGKTKGEFISLKNISSKTIDISGWRLSDESDFEFAWVIPKNVSLAGGESIKIGAGKSESKEKFHAPISLSYRSAIVYLFDVEGNLVDLAISNWQQPDKPCMRSNYAIPNCVAQ